MTNKANLPDFMKLWNYNDPIETETKFRELLPLAVSSGDHSYHAQLLTQIARTFSLRSQFAEAHTLLEGVRDMLSDDMKLARVRYLLELGRTFNSSNQQNLAMPIFIEASELASTIGEESLAIDAIHMIAIAERDPIKQVEWNLKGIEMAVASEKARAWLRALYNNIGESFLVLKDYVNALEHFRKLEAYEIERKGSADIFIKKDIAKCLRFLGNPENAADLMQNTLDELLSKTEDDGYIREELAEDLFALGKSDEAKIHFKRAFELLSIDGWYKTNGNLSRLEELSS
ncbi:MAG: hypothetical protein WCH46_05005 [bacterium]